MEFLIKSGIGTLLAVVAASSALFAQNSGPDKLQNHPSILDARQIVALSVATAERSWQARGLVTPSPSHFGRASPGRDGEGVLESLDQLLDIDLRSSPYVVYQDCRGAIIQILIPVSELSIWKVFFACRPNDNFCVLQWRDHI